MPFVAQKRFGADANLAVGKSTSWGATLAARTKFFDMLAESGGHDPGRQQVNLWRGKAPLGYIDVGAKSPKTITVPMSAQYLGIILRAFFGSYTFTAGPTTHNQHDFKVSTTKPTPIDVEIANSDPAPNASALIYRSCYGKKLTLNFNSSDLSTLDLDLLGLPEENAAKTTIGTIAPIANLAKPGQYLLVLDSDTGVSLELDSLSISFDTGLDDGRVKVRSSAAIVEPEVISKVSVSGSFARDWFSQAMYLKLISGAPVSLLMTYTGPVIGGAFVDNFKFIAKIPQLIIKSGTPNHSGAGLVQEQISFEAQDDATDGVLKITTWNDETTY